MHRNKSNFTNKNLKVKSNIKQRKFIKEMTMSQNNEVISYSRAMLNPRDDSLQSSPKTSLQVTQMMSRQMNQLKGNQIDLVELRSKSEVDGMYKSK